MNPAAMLIALFNRDNALEARLWSSLYRLLLGRVGRGARISRASQILNPGRIFVGDDVAIRHGARLDALRQFGGRDYDGSIHIGDRTSIDPEVHIAAAARLVIGHDVLIGDRVYISDHDHQFADLTLPVAHQPLLVAPVTIDDGVTIGAGAAILKGVSVGRHAVVGANSVVTKDVPPHAVVAGVPAKLVPPPL